MNYLSATGLRKAYGVKVLFDELTFGVSRGQKIALVGRNGCGKSSLLRILASKDGPDKGEVSFRNGIRTAFLDQNPEFPGAKTVFQAVFTGDDPKLTVIREYERLVHAENADADQLQEAMDQMEVIGAWDYESRVKEVLGKVGLYSMEQNLDELSGGQLKRLALGRVLIQEPDFLILDEPTNHLDTETIEWLEGHLAASNVTLMLVTHDRYFLDRVCNEVMELDRGEMFRYTGDYENFLEKKAGRESARDADASRATNLLRKELEWLRRQPKARTTKNKARIGAADVLMDRAEGQTKEKDIHLNFKARRMGGKILELDKINKSYDDLVLIKNFSHVFKRGERIGIVGPNGVGKTTFLDIVTGKGAPDTGDVDTGQTVAFGYYAQHGLDFKPGQRVLEIITDAAEQIKMGSGETLSASQALTLFGFPPGMQRNHVSELSGGEKRRLFLLRVLMKQPNFLILDEPTNDLDIITLNTLEQFLLAFDGCLIIVSHDRYFLDKLCDHLFIFEGEGKIKPFPGTFRQYREKKAKDALAAPSKKEAAKAEKQGSRVQQREHKKLSYKEQKEYEGLEGKIAKLEKEKAELVEKMNSGSDDYAELQGWSEALKTINADLGTKEDRWLELADRMGE